MSRFAAFAALSLLALYFLAGMSHEDAGIAGIVGASALVASIAGFAFSALAGSAFAYLGLDPLRAVHTLVLCSTAIQLYAVWKIRESIRWRPLWPMIAAGAVTVPLGVWILRHAASGPYAIGLGLFLCAYGTYAVFRREGRALPASRSIDLIAGALGGLTGGLAGLPGPAITIWYSLRGIDKLAQRAAYQPFILAMQIVSIVCLHWQDSSVRLIMADARFVPFAMIGGVAGFALYQHLTNRQFQSVTSILLVVSGMGLLARAL